MRMQPWQKWLMTDEKDGHKWGFWKNDTFQCCKICGMVRRADDKNKPCRGKPEIALRAAVNARVGRNGEP